MNPTPGYQDLLELVLFGCSLGECAEGLLDGKFDQDDIGNVVLSVQKAPAALKDADKGLQAYLALSTQEKESLKAAMVQEFDLENDGLEAVVEQVFKLLVDLNSLAALFLKKKPAPVVPVPAP